MTAPGGRDPQDLDPEALAMVEDALADPSLRARLPEDLAHLVRAYDEVEAVARRVVQSEAPPAGYEERLQAALAPALAEAVRTPVPGRQTKREDTRGPARRWWGRGASLWLAVAGSAAVVLWWVRTSPEETQAPYHARPVSLETEPAASREDAAMDRAPAAGGGASAAAPPAAVPAPGEAPSPGAPAAPPEAKGAREVGRLERAAPTPFPKAETDHLAEGASTGRRARRRRRTRAPRVARPRPTAKKKSLEADSWEGAGGAAGPTVPPRPAGWNTVAEADRLRRTGRCDRARPLYRAAAGSADPRIAARGHAGLGLCARAEGRSGEADLARARALDPKVSAFIEAERSR